MLFFEARVNRGRVSVGARQGIEEGSKTKQRMYPGRKPCCSCIVDEVASGNGSSHPGMVEIKMVEKLA